jgi:hypothetical protein
MVSKLKFQITYHHLTKVGGMRDISIGLPPTFLPPQTVRNLNFLK